MQSEKLVALGLERYAAAIRSDTATPYECQLFFENWYRFDGDDKEELYRKAGLTLVRHDPFFVAVSPHASIDLLLTDEEIEACVKAWALQDKDLAAFLEAVIRLSSASRRNPDPNNIKKALVALDNSESSFGEELQFLEMRANALGILGDDRYKSAFDKMLEATSPEWRAHPLQNAMEAAVASKDWERYDALRERWGEMPHNSHICECYTNFVANIDGVRALDNGDLPKALRCLTAAVEVNGCPHLNTGGAHLELARELLRRNLAIDELMKHLDAAENYKITDETTELRKQLVERARSAKLV